MSDSCFLPDFFMTVENRVLINVLRCSLGLSVTVFLETRDQF